MPGPPTREPPRGSVGKLVASFGLMADWRSRLRLAWIKLAPRLGRRGGDAVALRLRPLGGHAFHVRPGTSDMGTIYHDFVELEHLPPRAAREREMRQICELGTNVGAGLAGLAAAYPQARLVGVEPNPANAAIARLNVEPFGSRCRVLETAIWDREAELVVEGDSPSGYTVRELRPGEPRERAVAATTIEAMLEREFPEGPIDYLILNLEGTEPRVLEQGAGWAERVLSLRTELHPHHGFQAADCVRLLEALGFQAWAEPDEWGGWGFGLRE